MKFLAQLICLAVLMVTALAQSPDEKLKLETSFDRGKNETTVRMPPVRLSGDRDKYHSLHMSPAFRYAGVHPARPQIIDFELRTVVKGRLKTDLYVLFVVDNEKIFLSSNRTAMVRPVPGRAWMGEKLVFRMPYETLLKIAAARKLQIRMDGVIFEVSEEHLETIRAFAEKVKLLPGAIGQ